MAARSPYIPQEMLPGMPFDPVDVDRRNALARALNPNYLGMNVGDYADITPTMLELASADNLRTSLIDVKPVAHSHTVALREGSSTWHYIAVTPMEFGLMSGSIQVLGQRAVSASEKKRRQPHGLSDVDKAAADRAGVHAVESRSSVMQKYLDNTLIGQAKHLSDLQKAGRDPGLAVLKGKEGRMREELAYFRTFIVGDMLAAIGSQRHWTASQEKLALQSIERRLFIERGGSRHIDNFRAMVDLAQEWNGYRQAVIKSRLWESKRYVEANQPHEPAAR